MNNSSTKKSQLLIAAALLASSAGVNAQDTGTRTSTMLEEVVVTAQKRATSLQSTPVAISAFSGGTLEKRGIDDLANLQSYVPSLHIGQEQDGFKISLRGIGLQGTSSISDSGVAFYIDNNYIARPSGGTAVFHDIERIEVLRGPQGTLYGRNATGGVVNVISKQPSNEFEAEIGASIGERNLTEINGIVNFPITDNVAARISAVYTEEDGYVENKSTQPGTDDFFGTNGDTTVKGQLLFGQVEDLEVLVSATYSKLEGTGVNMTFLERNIGGPGPTQALLGTLPADSTDPLVTNNDSPAYNNTETTSAFVRATKDFGGFEGLVQASYLTQESNLLQDFDGSAINISIFNKDQDSDAESLEFRLTSDDSSALTWIVGGYYFSEDTYIFRRVRLNGLVGGGTVFINLPDFLLDETGESETLAAFGTVTYNLNDALRVSLGLRHTEDEKSGTKVTRGNFGAPFPADVPNSLYPGKADFSKTTGRLGLEWDAADNVFVYATVSNGYKAGGFNLTSNGLPYDPETLNAFEFGVKSDVMNGRARINVDTFYYEYEDMQLTTLTTINNAPGQFTTNAAKSIIYGLELETQFILTDNLQLNASYSYINAEFDELYSTDTRNPSPVFNPNDPQGLGRADLSGFKIPYVSENTINLGLQYDINLNSGASVQAGINFAWKDDLYLREHNDPTIDLVKSNTKTDVTVTYQFADIDLAITGYATNLEDDVQKTNVYVSPGFIGLSGTTAYTKPRTAGIRFKYTF